MARAAPRRAVLPLRRHLGPARALGRARLLHQPDTGRATKGSRSTPPTATGRRPVSKRTTSTSATPPTAARSRWWTSGSGACSRSSTPSGLRENTLVFFTSDHGFYFGEHDYFGKAEWVHDPEAAVTADSSRSGVAAPSPGCLTVERSPLYRELTNVPLMVRGPGLEPGRTQAMTTAPDLAPTIMELAGLGGVPTTMTGDSFGGVLDGSREEHRPLVVSSWPLYLAEGEIVTAIDSKARRIADYMPLTVTTPRAVPDPGRTRTTSPSSTTSPATPASRKTPGDARAAKAGCSPSRPSRSSRASARRRSTWPPAARRSTVGGWSERARNRARLRQTRACRGDCVSSPAGPIVCAARSSGRGSLE